MDSFSIKQLLLILRCFPKSSYNFNNSSISIFDVNRKLMCRVFYNRVVVDVNYRYAESVVEKLTESSLIHDLDIEINVG